MITTCTMFMKSGEHSHEEKPTIALEASLFSSNYL